MLRASRPKFLPSAKTWPGRSNSNPLNKKFIISLICLGATIVVLIGLVRPAWQALQDNRLAIKKLQSKLTLLEGLLNQTKKLEKEEAEIKEEGQKILLALPEEKDIPALLVQFETLASVHNLVLNSIDFQEVSPQIRRRPTEEPKKTAAFSRLIVNLKVSGSYRFFKEYLNALENNIRAMNVQSINFSTASPETDIFDFDIKIEVYYQIKQ